MALPITFNNKVYGAGFFGTDDGAPATTFRVDDTYNFPVTVNGTVNKAGDTVTLTYTLPGATTATTQTLTATNFDSPDMIEFAGTGVPGTQDGSANRYLFSNTQVFGTGDPNRTRFTADDAAVGSYAVCYMYGTRIRAIRDGIEGEIEVETLRVGDLAVTASGAHRPIRWIGRRSYSGVFANRNFDLLPVCFSAHSIGDNIPSRDLWVSPKHAMALDGVLVAAENLVNGTSVTKAQRVDSLQYFHIELDSHDVLIAEGAESESYVDDDNRNFFHNASDAARLGFEMREAVYCLPRVEDGFALEAIRQRLNQRALALQAVSKAA